MFNNPSGQNQRKKSYKNPLEAIGDFGSSTVKKTFDAFSSIGSGMVDQLFGTFNENTKSENLNEKDVNKIKKELKKTEKKRNIFNYTEYHENVLIKRQIKELTEQIRREVQALRRADSSLLNEVKDIENIAINSLPEKPGIYHVRFLEIILNIIRALRAKVSESKTWLAALISKKKKRGSLFAVRTKKYGTQYSLSQELQSARSIQ